MPGGVPKKRYIIPRRLQPLAATTRSTLVAALLQQFTAVAGFCSSTLSASLRNQQICDACLSASTQITDTNRGVPAPPPRNRNIQKQRTPPPSHPPTFFFKEEKQHASLLTRNACMAAFQAWSTFAGMPRFLRGRFL